MSLSSAEEVIRLKVRLPAKIDQDVTWEELAELEKLHGIDEIKKWLKGGKLIFPIDPVEVKHPEFIKHMEKLRRRSEQREYARMVENVLPPGMSLSKSMNSSYSPEHTGVGANSFQYSVIGLNIVIGMGCAFVATDYLSRQYGLSDINRALVSLTSMVFILFVEMTLFIIRASKFDKLDRARYAQLEENFTVASGIAVNPPQEILVKKNL